ncbi:33642_t:CDS:2, partial [Gigaspora margarita]
IKGDNQIKEIIAGGNELSSLDLTNCANLTKLMVADNVYLNEIKGLNLATITNLNITNTSVNLAQDYEELKAEKERLLGVIENLKEGGEEGKLMLTEAIEKCLAYPEKALPAFQVPETQTSHNYQELYNKWNEKEEYNGENDFDCGKLLNNNEMLTEKHSITQNETGLNQKFFKEVIENSHLSEESKKRLDQLTRLKYLEGILADYEPKIAELKTWNDTFGEKKPEEVQEKITNLEKEYSDFKQKSEEQIQELTKKCELVENKLEE